jgi:beta-glucosidase
MLSLSTLSIYALALHTSTTLAWSPVKRQGQQGADMGGQAGSGGGGGEAQSSAASAASSAVSSASGAAATSATSAASSAGSITASSSTSAEPTMIASTTTDATGGVTVYMTSISTVTAPGTCAPQATDSLVPGTTIPDGYTSPQIEYPLVANSSYYHFNSRWADAHQKARDYLSGWTVEEKSQLCTGTGWSFGRCVGNIPPIPSQNFSGLCLQDSPLGVRFADRVSAFPAGINSGSTFDKDLMYARGYAMGSEYKAKGVNIALGPAIDIGRNAAGGRDWESFGADPYLMGIGAEMTIRGMQDAGVQAT